MKTNISNYEDRRVYNIKFHNLTDLYDYLKSNPTVNTKVFSEQASMKSGSFYGEPLSKSIEYIIGGYVEGINNFLETSNDLKKLGKQDESSYHVVRSLHGGRPLAPLVAMGVPDCMLKQVRNDNVNVVNIYYQLAYPASTEESQIVNRGLAALYIIQALEEKGYLVNFKAFELSSESDEIVNININLKKPSDLFLNVEKCYFPIKGKEFLRRILFRVLESTNVTDRNWGEGYGSSMNLYEIREFYKLKHGDLIIGTPNEMNIKGTNIYKDTINMIEKLNIASEFDMDKLRKRIK